ncbi:MAG TPA: serine/threonine-protein kinase [Ktedonobacteraceae bacterium]|nr:serine/threonine-protein kinase [Ktedonobacteraceae bacterium]
MVDHGEREGQRLGNYRLTRLLGRGGFAEVYAGEHIHLGTQAAIKVLKARLTSEQIEPFRNEARTIAHLRHRHIIRVLDFDVDDGVPFLVMDYATNGTLRQRYPPGICLTPADILPFVKQAAVALDYAHSRKLIHRDVKPENLLLDADNELLLSDFGIAVIAHTSSSGDIQDQAGTIPYMAPEQIRGRPRIASDQYSLGVVVYEWLTGSRPFTGTVAEIITQILTVPPQPLRKKNPAISGSLEQVVERALAKDAHQRFTSVLEFAQAFEATIEPGRITQSTSLPASMRLSPSTATGTNTSEATPPQQNKKTDQQRVKEQLLAEGNAHAMNGNYQEAIRAYDRAIALDPNDAAAYNARGIAHYALKQFQAAIADFEQAITLDSMYQLAYQNFNLAYSALKEQYLDEGNGLYNAGEYQQAIAAYDRAIALDPQDARAFNFRGSAYFALRQFSQAIADFKQAIALQSDYAIAHQNCNLAYSALKSSKVR